MSFHQTIIEGHLGRDPETRYMPSGDAVCNFSVAVTETWKDKSGDKKESTTWYRVNAFGKLADVCGQYLTKGAHVLVVGKMSERKWEKDGIERTSWELRADSMRMLGSKGDAKPQQSPARDVAGSGAGSSVADFEDDIPFLFNESRFDATIKIPGSLARTNRARKGLLQMRKIETNF